MRSFDCIKHRLPSTSLEYLETDTKDVWNTEITIPTRGWWECAETASVGSFRQSHCPDLRRKYGLRDTSTQYHRLTQQPSRPARGQRRIFMLPTFPTASVVISSTPGIYRSFTRFRKTFISSQPSHSGNWIRKKRFIQSIPQIFVVRVWD